MRKVRIEDLGEEFSCPQLLNQQFLTSGPLVTHSHHFFSPSYEYEVLYFQNRSPKDHIHVLGWSIDDIKGRPQLVSNYE